MDAFFKETSKTNATIIETSQNNYQIFFVLLAGKSFLMLGVIK